MCAFEQDSSRLLDATPHSSRFDLVKVPPAVTFSPVKTDQYCKSTFPRLRKAKTFTLRAV